MSVMAGLTAESSVFTFESTVHFSQVLHRLNEQRCRDMFCDVTVVVEGKSFRAHRSVLASCSEYLLQRISSLTQHGAVITLPEEVTVAGFEPLLKFAYTSKLNFGKDDVLEIRNSASILGFRDLDEACFNFLMPKFFSSRNGSAPIVKKSCCRKECKRRLSKENFATDSDDVFLDHREVKPVADSSPEDDVTRDWKKSVSNKMGSQNGTDSSVSEVEAMNDPVIQGPKYRKFQLACEKGMFASEKYPLKPVTSRIIDSCVLSCLPCPNMARCKRETVVDFTGNVNSNPSIESKVGAQELCENLKHNVEKGNCSQKFEDEIESTFERKVNKPCKVQEKSIKTYDESMKYTSEISSEIPGTKTPKPSAMLCERSSLPFCPLMCMDVESTITKSVGRDICGVSIAESKISRESGTTIPCSSQKNKKSEDEGKKTDDPSQQGGKKSLTSELRRGAVIRENSSKISPEKKEMANHVSEQLKPSKSKYEQSFLDFEAGYSRDALGGWEKNSSSERSNLQNGLGSTKTGCPFDQDFGQIPCGMFECEGKPQSCVSSVNSGEDGDYETETEGDSELSTSERALQVKLPYSVDWIVNLNRNDFQHLLKQQVLNQEQLEFVHEIRRRSKNRLAAQRCRKRKLDCIYNLQCEINKLKTEREKLIMERDWLTQKKRETCHTVSTLCERVCNEGNLLPEQLQVLASCTASDCPISSLVPQIDALLSQHGSHLHPQEAFSQENTSKASTDTGTWQT